jgi:alkylation response protein AidB-like acyl-CoA dehydrogenase
MSTASDAVSLGEAARGFLARVEWRNAALDELWRAIVGQGWLEALLAPDADAPVGLLMTLNIELGRAGLVLPLTETVGPLLAMGRFGLTREAVRLRAGIGMNAPLATVILHDGSHLRRDAIRLQAGQASGLLHNVEHLGIARGLFIVDVDATRFLWCRLPSPGIDLQPSPGYASPAWQDLRLAEVAAGSCPARHAQGWLRDAVRLAAVARASGAAEASLRELTEYVKVREQFGQAIGRFQAMQHRLANLRVTTAAARALIDHAAAALDGGDGDACSYVDAACAYGSEALPQAALDCHHGFGAVGYMEDHPMPGRCRRIHADLARHAHRARAAASLGSRLLERADGPELITRRLTLTAEAEKLRTEVSAWLEDHWTPEQAAYARHDGAAVPHFNRGFLADIGRRGFIGLTVSRADGGLGQGALEQFAFDEETHFREVPYYSFATAKLLAPSVARFGTAAQRAHFLPLMLGGKAVFCLGYSEPNAGSDLASLRTRAVRDGDGWIVTGQKIWTSLGTVGDYLWLAARTGDVTARHAGISVFVTPLTTPGITVRPLRAMNGESPCAIFLDEVRLSADALIGEVDGGWAVITHALAQERMLMGGFGSRLALQLSRVVRELQRLAAAQAPPHSAAIAPQLGRMAARVQACRLLALQASRAAAGADAAVEAAISKVFASELEEHLAEACIGWLGPDALLARTAPGAVLEGSVGHGLVMGIMYVVGGGSNDIQRNIIAQRGLGLAR